MAAKATATGRKEASIAVEWACPTCTFLNKPTASTCNMCGDSAPGVEEIHIPGDRLFQYLDGKGCVKDGVLAWAEFVPLCQRMKWDPATAQRLWFETDHDKSGNLSRMEFLRFAARPDVWPLLGPFEDEISAGALDPNAPGARLFDFLDGKGHVKDGMLAWTEFAPLCQQLGWPLLLAEQMWYQTDKDRSGTLSRVEFLRFVAKPEVLRVMGPYEAKLPKPTAVATKPQEGKTQKR